MILKTNWLKQADQIRGRFRSLLLKSVQNFLHNVSDTKQTLKRGGGVDSRFPQVLKEIGLEA